MPIKKIKCVPVHVPTYWYFISEYYSGRNILWATGIHTGTVYRYMIQHSFLVPLRACSFPSMTKCGGVPGTWYSPRGTTPTGNIQDKIIIPVPVYEYDIVKFIYRTVARRYAPEPIVHMCSC